MTRYAVVVTFECDHEPAAQTLHAWISQEVAEMVRRRAVHDSVILSHVRLHKDASSVRDDTIVEHR